MDFYHHIDVNDIISNNIGVDIVNRSSIKNFLTIDVHLFKILLKDVLVF